MKNEILVTGATGFLGQHLVAALQRDGHRLRQHSSIDGDIARCDLPMEGVGHVFHLAAKTFVPESWKEPRSFYEVNVLGTLNVLDHCRRHGAALTLVSSYVYGTPQRLPIDEEHPLAAFNPYSQTKILAEETARFYERYYDLRLVLVRPFNLYGPGQSARFLIPSLVHQAIDPMARILRVKNLRSKRDYLYVEDAVALLTRTVEPNIRGTYNVGSGSSASVEDVAQLVNRAAGENKPLVCEEEERPVEVMDVVADVSRAKNELGWSPQTELGAGIAATVAAERRLHA